MVHKGTFYWFEEIVLQKYTVDALMHDAYHREFVNILSMCVT